MSLGDCDVLMQVRQMQKMYHCVGRMLIKVWYQWARFHAKKLEKDQFYSK